MATEEWLRKAIAGNKSYEDLPPRVQALVPVSEWRLRCVPAAALRCGAAAD